MTGNLIATFLLEDGESAASEALQGRLWVLGCSGQWQRHPREVNSAGVPSQSPESRSRDSVGEGPSGPACANDGHLLDAYFTDDDWRPDLGAELSVLAEQHDARFVGFELLLERDWMETHRRLAQPRIVGDFVIDPREPDDPVAEEPLGAAVDGVRWRLRVPARQAFGTGSHETTRLTLVALSEIEVSGATVVDVGCGSGVLSFAAHRLGAVQVFGYDVDPVAGFASRVNAGLNEIALGPALRFAAGSQEMLVKGLADVLLVNVLPEKIEDAEPALSDLAADGGTIVVSGLLGGDPLPSSTVDALERWNRLGWSPARTYEEGEWLAYRLVRAGQAEERCR